MTGADKLLWRGFPHGLRILCYHGTCDDRLAGAPWVPGYFVTAGAFEQQLQYLQRNARVLPLGEALDRLRDGTLPPRCVSLTFDDGYANNVEVAYPLLRKYGMSATVFLSTAYIESGDLFPFIKLALLRLDPRFPGSQLPDYKTAPLDEVARSAAAEWHKTGSRLTDDQFRTLRPLSIEEIQSVDSTVMDFGAHTHTHCILKNETNERRTQEINVSVRKVAQWTGRPSRLFSYPNGQRGDFGEVDRRALEAEGIEAAVTGIAGANDRRTEMLELRRYPIGLYHDLVHFRAEVSGFRTTLLKVAGRSAS
jgi:peptidoglycan/xylan/chitin deacetylase (PgdA/CDA1 family)